MSLFFSLPEASTSAGPSTPPPHLPPLDSLVLLPLTRRAYALAQTAPARLVELLSSQPGAIIRTGDILSLGSEWVAGPDAGSSGGGGRLPELVPDDGEVRAWRVVMTEPVLAGVFVPTRPDDDDDELPGEEGEETSEETQILVAPFQPSRTDPGGNGDAELDHLARSTSSLSQRSDSSSASSQRTVKPILSPPPTPPPELDDAALEDEDEDEDDDEDAEDDFEITSSFLQSALLSSSTSALPPGPSDGASLSDSVSSLTSSHSGGHRPQPSGKRFQAGALAARLGGGGGASEEDECTMWVRARVLGEVGCFDGDWVAVKALAPDVADDPYGDWRVVRVRAIESSKDVLQPVNLPPMILRNLAPLLVTPTFETTPELSLVLTAFPPSAPPPLPTAVSVTLERLASPASTSKLLQKEVVGQLRAYFERKGAGRRVLKVGDLIGIPVDEGAVEETEEEGASAPLPNSESVRPTTAVFFRVLHMRQPKAAPSDAAAPASPESWESRAQRGDFGCMVDPAVTMIVQAGSGKGLGLGGPFVDWLGVGSFLPLPLSPAAHKTLVNLHRIVASALQPSMASFGLQISVILKGARGCGKRTMVRSLAARMGLGVLEVNCYEVVGETDAKTEGVLRARFERAATSSPCILLLRHVEALARKSQSQETGKEPQIAAVLKDCIESLGETWKASEWPVIVIGTTGDADKVPAGILGSFKEDFVISAPDERERLRILETVLDGVSVSADVDLGALAVETAALVAQDLVSLVRGARNAALQRVILRRSAPLTDFALAGLPLTSADFVHALDAARSSYSESIGAPKIPNVSWEDVGGLATVKREILDTVELPLMKPELFASGLKKRSGILLYGPPGTGKTLLAKAVATSCSLNFFSVKGPELLNMYIGESEANVRRVFQRARDAKPCVIFFDELDSVAPKRGNQGDSGGVMDRIVSQLLAELDGMAGGDGSGDVFVIGATNRPDLLDPALLRPGRFDRMLYLGVSDTHDAQLKIIEALTRKFKLDPALRLDTIAARCPFNYTGADFYALCSDAMLKAMTRKAEEIDRTIAAMNAQPPSSAKSVHPHPMTPQYYLSELVKPAEVEVLVSQADFELALRELNPSVSEGEMLHYREVQQQFQGPAPAGEAEARPEEADGDTPQPTNGVLHGAQEKPSKGKGKGKGKARA